MIELRVSLRERSRFHVGPPQFKSADPGVQQSVCGCDLLNGFVGVFSLHCDQPRDDLAVSLRLARQLGREAGGDLLRFGKISSIHVAEGCQKLNLDRRFVHQRLVKVRKRCRLVSLQLFEVRQRRVFPGGAVVHLGCHIGGGSLRKDARCVRILPLIGSKIG